MTTVTLDPNGGTGSPVDQIAAASTALTTNTFTKQYYTFAGWNTAADGTGTSYTDGGTYDFTAGGTTLYAQWTGASQTITYNANGGSGSESDTTGPTDASVTLSSGSGLSRTGYTLIGWSTSSSATTADYALGSSITMPGGGLSLYAVWSGDVQTITYNANGGSGSVSDTTGTTGSSVTLPSGTGLSRLGYSLLGWDTSASATTPTYSPGASVTMPAGGLALYAIWGVASQTITYNANGGSGSVADTTGNTGTTVTLASGASLSGGTSSFLGWSATASDTTPTYSAGASVTMPAGGLALYAIWDPPIVVPTPEPTPPPPPLWTLGFDANGGTCTSSSGQAFDTAWLTLPGADACTRAGYEFAGWNTAADGSGTGFPPGGSTQMSGDNTLYAQWTKVVTPILPPAPAPTPDPSGSAAPAPDPSPAPTSSSPSPSTPSPGGTPGSNGAGPIPAPNPMPTGGGVNLRPSQGSIVQPNGGIVDPLAGASAGPGGSLAGASVSIWDGTRWTQQFTDPGVGTWLVEAGKVRFLPVPGFTGTASTTMRVVDTNGNAGYAPISFTVAPEPATSPSPEPSGTRGRGSDGLGPVPPPPPLSPTESGVVVYPQGSALSGSGGAVNVLDGAIPSTGAQVDPDSVVLWDGASWVSSFDDPGVGSWRVVGGRVEFTPAVGFCGTASTTAKVSDTSGRAGTAPVAFARSCTSPGSDGTGVVPAPPPYPFDGSSGPQPQRRVVTGTADSDGGVVDLAAALGDAAADLNTARLWDGQAWVTSFTDPGVGTWRIVNGRVIFTPAKRFRGTARTTFWVAGSDGTPIQGPISFTVDQPCFDPSSRQLVIGFDPTKASLSRSDRAKIRAFMEQGCSYSIVGYVQAAGPTSNDLSLSRARADVVARYAKKGDYGKPIKVTGGGRWAQDACGEFENRCVVIRSVRTNPASAIPTRSGVSKATLGPALAVGDGLSVLHGMGEASGPMPASPGGGHACHQGGDIWGAAEPLRCS